MQELLIEIYNSQDVHELDHFQEKYVKVVLELNSTMHRHDQSRSNYFNQHLLAYYIQKQIKEIMANVTKQVIKDANESKILVDAQ